MLNMNIEYTKGVLFVRLTGKLDRSSSYKINKYLIPVILKQKIKYLVYNLDNLEALDDDGKDALLNTEYAIQTNKGKLYLSDVKSNLIKQINKLHLKQISHEDESFNLMEA